MSPIEPSVSAGQNTGMLFFGFVAVGTSAHQEGADMEGR